MLLPRSLHKTYMVDAELNKKYQIFVHDALLSIGPAAHAGAASRLVGVFASCVQLSVPVLHGVDRLVCELRSLMVERLRVRQDLLERRCVNLVCYRLAIDGVPHPSVLDFEDAVGVVIDIVAAGGLNDGLSRGVTSTMWVEIRAWHRVSLVVDQAILVAIDGRINSQRKNVLMMSSKNSRMNDSSPGYLNSIVNRLRGKNSCSADLVRELAGLVEHEGHDVFVVRDSNNGLQDKLPIANNGRSACTIVGMFPTNAPVAQR